MNLIFVFFIYQTGYYILFLKNNNFNNKKRTKQTIKNSIKDHFIFSI